LIVVADTSPILNLARIGRLELLPALYHHVLIPTAVYDELTRRRSGLPPVVSLASMPWLTVAAAIDQNRVRKLKEDLDPGEAEAIVLAIERRADLVLLDERRGRRIATAQGLEITGLLGVVVKAKQAGLIELGKPVMDDLIQFARFWIGPDLYRDVLRELDES
jgi:predicted nucleic acid-binding protein